MVRVKEITTTIGNDAEADQILKEIAELNWLKSSVDNWANDEIKKIKEEAVKKLIVDKKTELTVDDRITALSANLLAYVKQCQMRFLQGKRSEELNHGKIGYRLGNPEVVTLGNITFKAIMSAPALVKKLKLWGWVKETVSLSKQAILDKYAEDKEKTLKLASQVSLGVRQDDEPYFDIEKVEIKAASMPKPEFGLISKN